MRNKSSCSEPENKDAFDVLLNKLNKAYGNNSIYRASDYVVSARAERISTGSPQIDHALGGGIPLRKVILVTGLESSGKTFFVLKCLAQHTALGRRVAFVDVERTFNKSWAEACGVNTDLCFHIQAPHAERYLDIVQVLMSSGEFDAIAIDSMAALTPAKSLNSSHEDQQMGLEGKMQSRFYREVLAAQFLAYQEGRTEATLYCINQIRNKITLFGNPEVLPGGFAQHFYSSIKINFKKESVIYKKKSNQEPGEEEEKETAKKNLVAVGQDILYTISKNKTAQPNISGTVAMYTSPYKGLSPGDWDSTTDLIEVGLKAGVIEKGGAWFSGPAKIKCQGRANLWHFLRDNTYASNAVLEAIKVCYPDMDLAFTI